MGHKESNQTKNINNEMTGNQMFFLFSFIACFYSPPQISLKGSKGLNLCLPICLSVCQKKLDPV